MKNEYFTLAFAIKCWDCDSYTDRNCGDPFNNRTLSVTDCSLIADRNMQKCRKIVQKSMLIFTYANLLTYEKFNNFFGIQNE